MNGVLVKTKHPDFAILCRLTSLFVDMYSHYCLRDTARRSTEYAEGRIASNKPGNPHWRPRDTIPLALIELLYRMFSTVKFSLLIENVGFIFETRNLLSHYILWRHKNAYLGAQFSAFFAAYPRIQISLGVDLRHDQRIK